VAGLAVIVSGPTEFSIIRDRVQTLLARGLGPDYHVEIGRSVVDVDPALGLVAEIDDIAVRDSRNAVVARVPSIRLALDPIALLSLRSEVCTVEFHRADVSPLRSADGDVYLGNAETEYAAAAARSAAAAAAAPGEHGRLPDLLAALQIVDRGMELDQRRREGRLSASPRSMVRSRSGTPSAPSSAGLRAPTSTSRSMPPRQSDRQRRQFRLWRPLDGNLPAPGRYVDRGAGALGRIPAAYRRRYFPELGAETSEAGGHSVYGHATAHFAADGTVQEASTELDVGAGTITFGERREKMPRRGPPAALGHPE
jgi:hypothetical protein